MELAGTMIVRNAVKYDYCLKPALESLADCCDKVFVLECGSLDETMDLIEYVRETHDNIEVFNGNWNVAKDRHRLRILTDTINKIAFEHGAKYIFNLQADEVIHEDSFDAIRNAIRTGASGITIKRINLWRDFDHYVEQNNPKKPCSVYICRIAKRGAKANTDAESLYVPGTIANYADKILVFHYGFLRDPKVQITKCINMQSWFGLGVDVRIVRMKNSTGLFDPDTFIDPKTLTKLNHSHPKYIKDWMTLRKRFW